MKKLVSLVVFSITLNAFASSAVSVQLPEHSGTPAQKPMEHPVPLPTRGEQEKQAMIQALKDRGVSDSEIRQILNGINGSDFKPRHVRAALEELENGFDVNKFLIRAKHLADHEEKVISDNPVAEFLVEEVGFEPEEAVRLAFAIRLTGETQGEAISQILKAFRKVNPAIKKGEDGIDPLSVLAGRVDKTTLLDGDLKERFAWGIDRLSNIEAMKAAQLRANYDVLAQPPLQNMQDPRDLSQRLSKTSKKFRHLEMRKRIHSKGGDIYDGDDHFKEILQGMIREEQVKKADPKKPERVRFAEGYLQAMGVKKSKSWIPKLPDLDQLRKDLTPKIPEIDLFPGGHKSKLYKKQFDLEDLKNLQEFEENFLEKGMYEKFRYNNNSRLEQIMPFESESIKKMEFRDQQWFPSMGRGTRIENE